VDPDVWLTHIHRQAYARRVQPKGTIAVKWRDYYISQALAGQQVVRVVNAPERRSDVLLVQSPDAEDVRAHLRQLEG